MSDTQIDPDGHLKRLRNEGYDLSRHRGFLLVRDVPYVTSSKTIELGVLVMKIGDVVGTPEDHVAFFKGSQPCSQDGSPIAGIINSSSKQTLADGVEVDHTLSAKPPAGNYPDFYEKVTTYVALISAHATALDPTASARTYPTVLSELADDDCPFCYVDTASSRAEIDVVSDKLRLPKVAIVGLGGTGSYILDLLAKCPVREIHLFDGDVFSQHNAFRAPGAASIEILASLPKKVTYFKDIYSQMHPGIVAHESMISGETVDQLREMSFVFISCEGAGKRVIVEALEEFDIPFVDVGMSITEIDGYLGGILRVTTSTTSNREHIRQRQRIPMSNAAVGNEYAQNIQVADLNMLNAALAVIKWKKLFGFYRDSIPEYYSTYTIDGNRVFNEDGDGAENAA